FRALRSRGTRRRRSGRRVAQTGELRFLAGRRVGMDDALCRRLVELLDRRFDLSLQLVRAALLDIEHGLDLNLDRLLDRSVAQPPLGRLSPALLGGVRMWHRGPFRGGWLKNSI